MNETMNKETIELMRQLSQQLKQVDLSTSNSAAQIILSTVPILGIVIGGLVLFFFFLWRYRINKELILTKQYTPSFWKNLHIFSLLVGSLSSTVGLPLTILFFWIDGISYTALGGLIPLFTGLGFILFYMIAHKNSH